jgi:Tol biopolymer transport system component
LSVTRTHQPRHPRSGAPCVRAGWRGSSWRLSALRGVLAAVVIGVLSASSVSPAAADDVCANAAVRAQANSTGLPDCRGYELVSSPYKEGFQVEPGLFLRFTDDGIVSYASAGSFADNPLEVLLNRYHATRSAAGWVTTSPAPPSQIYNTASETVQGESADLRSTLWTMSRRNVAGEKSGYYLRGPDGTFTRIGDRVDDVLGVGYVAGVSDDLKHVVFNHGNGSTLFEYVGTGNAGPPRAASVDNQGHEQGACINSVSSDGRVIVYSTGCGVGTPQVWARASGSATVAVSGSECTRTAGDPDGACNGVSAASYAGGAVDGSRVFFTTSQQLVNGDTDTGQDLYACDIPSGAPAPVGAANPCTTLTEVSGTATDAQVENVVAISKDGSRVYFVARGVLAGNLGVGDVGASTGTGAHNLYVWDRDDAHPAGTTRFVARLDASSLGRAQMTSDGRYLLFLTAGSMVTDGPGADTDGAMDAYRYDAVTKAMVRVSKSVSGGGGNGQGYDVSLIPALSMTADGSTVIFDSAEPLSVGDTDGVTDVYAWHDHGGVSLISAGGGGSLGISPSGRDIFFSTGTQVLAGDRDFNIDIYDARVGGGFAPVQTTPCSGDECRGQHSQPPSLAGPLSAGSGGLGEVAVSPAFSLRAVSAAQRKALAATGKVSLTVTTNAPGTINIKATATIGGRSVTVGSARRTLTAAEKIAVRLTLSKKARSQLAARGKLSVRIAVSHSKVALDRSLTLRLVYATPKAKAKRSAKRAHAQRSGVGVGGGRS